MFILCFVLVAAENSTHPLRAATVVEPASEITYTLTHRVHEVVGIANDEIQVQVGLDGTVVHLHVAVPVQRFASGNARRDATMGQTMDSDKFPLVEIFGQVSDAMPGHFPAKTRRMLTGELIFHGVHRSLSAPLELEWQSRRVVHVSAHFSFSLDAHRVERPSLMFVKVDDQLKISVNLDLQL